MSLAYGLSALAGIILIIWYISKFKWEMKFLNSAFLLVVIAFTVRFLAFFVTDGFPNDIAAFKYWSDILYKDGFKSFYTSEIFTDYPPGYMYILYVMGFIRHFLRIEDGMYHYMLLKLPSVLFDCAICALIYKIALRKSSKESAWLLSLSWALNPVSVLITSMWGQIDSIYAFFIAYSFFALTEKRYISAYSTYAAALLFKPQSLMFAPIYIYSAFELFKDAKELDMKAFSKFTDALFPAILVLIAGILPFTTGYDLSPVVRQYAKTLASYPHAAINAANLYSVLGLNWADLNHKLFGLVSCVNLALFCIVAVTILSFVILHKNKRDDKYFSAGAFICIIVFMFCVKMHERYIFSAIILLLCASALRKKRDYRFLYFAFSITSFINCAAVLYNYVLDLKVSDMNIPLAVIGVTNLVLTVFLIYRLYVNNKSENQW